MMRSSRDWERWVAHCWAVEPDTGRPGARVRMGGRGDIKGTPMTRSGRRAGDGGERLIEREML